MSAIAARAALVVVALLLAARAAAGAADERKVEADASLEPGVVGIEELVALTLTVESSGFSGAQVTPQFELDNLEVVAGPFQSRSQRWVNGVTSNSVQLTWRLRASAVGTAAVRAIRIRSGDRTIDLGERTIEVQAETPAGRRQALPTRRSDPFEDLFGRALPDTRRPPPRAPKLLLRAELSPAEPFVGQQATYTLWLYTQSDISAFQPTRIPDFRGLWVREVPQPAELKPEWVDIDGERFGRVPMLRRALFPLKPGRFVIDPTEADVVARIPDFGPFGSAFGRNESLRLKTEPLVLTARALPGAPPGFTGPVGEVAISVRMDRTSLAVGQAATLTVRCTGRGNLQSLSPPELQLPEGVRTFSPRQDASERLTDGMLVSSAEWSYVLVPDRPGNFTIGAVEIPYFDPARREFRTASAAPPAFAVTGEVAVAGSGPQPEPPAPESRTENARSPGWLDRIRAARVWYAAAGGLGLLAAALLVARRRPASTGRTSSGRTLRQAIADSAKAPTTRQAAAELEEAWRQYLAERWQVPPGTPVSGWTERLVAANANAGAAQELTALAHELQYLRYAPELSAADRLLGDALESSRRLARALR